ncbi:Acyltransferase [Gracilaria domingensis]|nr:Acyltransferase [Gracilaria domingensis]
MTENSTSPSDSTQSVDADENANESFIALHGRLRRPVCHPAFDPFRRHSSEPHVLVSILIKLCAVVLVPLRLLVAAVSVFLSYLVVKLFGPPVTKHSITHFEPTLLPRWRRRIVAAASKFLGRALLFSLGFWNVEGSDHPDYDHDKACKATVLTNHSSLADPCLLAYLYAPAFVAKSEVWKIPGIGRVGAGQHAFYIDRMENKGISVSQAISDRQRLVQDSAHEIPPVAIFPEGTTTNGRYLLPFKTGAFVSGLPVAPVLFRYEYKWFSPTYESIHTRPYLIGILSQLWNRVQYYRLPVYYPSEEEKKDAKLYAQNVHEMMVQESEVAFGGENLVRSTSNYVDKLEYHSIIRGTKLRKGLQLNADASQAPGSSSTTT